MFDVFSGCAKNIASGARPSRFDSICNPFEFEHLIFDGWFGTYLKLAQGYCGLEKRRVG